MDKPTPKIRKAKLIHGKNIIFRDAQPNDAEFILSLRTDKNKSKHLSKTHPNLKKQTEWLECYSRNSEEAYFIIESMDGDPLGTIRIYDARGNSFCWGSWILKDGSPKNASIESALMVYIYAIEHLGFKEAHFDVRKDNIGVWSFHERFGAQKVSENELDYFYEINLGAVKKSIKRFKKFLPPSLEIQW